jgi:hypothetical protein
MSHYASTGRQLPSNSGIWQVSRYQTIGADGSFTIPAVPEAHYRVQVQVAGGGGNRGGNRGGRGPIPTQRIAARRIREGNAYVADILLGGASIYDKGSISVYAGAFDIILKPDPGSVTEPDGGESNAGAGHAGGAGSCAAASAEHGA